MKARIDEVEGVVRIVVEGLLRYDEALELVRRVQRRYPAKPRFWDWRRADLTEWTIEQMRTLQGQIVGSEPTPGVRVAAVVARDVDYGISRMFEALVPNGHPVTYRVFRDPAQALRWVTGEDEEEEGEDVGR